MSAVTGDEELSSALGNAADFLDVISKMSWMNPYMEDQQFLTRIVEWASKASQVINDMSTTSPDNLNV